VVDNEQRAEVEAIDSGEVVLSMFSVGRPTLLEEKVAIEICQHIANGLPLRTTAGLVGIHERTISGWVTRGRRELEAQLDGIGDQPELIESLEYSKYSKFFLAIERAHAEAERFAVGVITTSAETTWQAAAWWLERNPRTRDTWRRPTQAQEIHVSGSASDEEKLDSLADRVQAMAKKVQR